jgi:hypothetical protein
MSERTNLIEALERLPNALRSAVHGLSEEQLDTPVDQGKWTLRQITHHIADANLNAYTRMKLVVTEEKPILKPYNQDQWAVLEDSKSGPIEPTLVLIKGLHERWVLFLRSLPESSWLREGIHLENGKVTLAEILKTYSRHGDSHMQQIITLREKMKW